MTKITIGEVYTANKFRSGSSGRGDWEMICVLDEKGKNEIAIYPTNIPTGARENCSFKLVDVAEVKNGVRKGTDGKWYPAVSISGKVEVIQSDINLDVDFDDPDGELPWKEGDFLEDIGLPL